MITAIIALSVCPQQAPPSSPVQDPEASAPQEPGQGKDQAAPEIVVIATRHEAEPRDVPRSVTVLSKDQLREKAPRTVAEALRFQPGIWVQKTGHLGGAPIIRGFMGNQVVYLFDGIRRNTASLFAGPNSFLQNIDALDVDRIEVIRGPGSVLYGSDAIGGVVNVISNEELAFSDGLDWGGRILGRYGSADQETSSRLEGFVTGERFNAFIGATRRDIGDLESGRGGMVQVPSSWYEHDFDGQAGWKVGDGQRLDFYFQNFKRPEGMRFDKPNWVQRNDRDLYTLRYRAQDLGFADSLDAKAYYHRQANFIDEKWWDSDSLDRSVGLDLQAGSQLSEDLLLTWGLTALRDSVSKSNPQKGTEDPDVDWQDAALFGLAEWQVAQDVQLSLGLRADNFSLDATAPPFRKLDSNVQNAINNGSLTLADLGQNRSDTAFTGGLGLSWDVTDSVTAYTHLGRAFRAPNKSDMLSFGAFTFGFNVPSPNLDPESSWTYEIGLKTQTDDTAVAVAGYLTTVSDGIVSQPGTFNGSSFIDLNGNGTQDAGEQVYVKQNSPDDIVVKGLELQAIHYLPDSWVHAVVDQGAVALYGNLTWMRGEDKGTNEPLDRGIPTNALLGIRWEDSRNPRQQRWWTALEAWAVDSFDRIPSSRYGDGAFHSDPQDPGGSPYLAPGPRVPGYTVFSWRGGVRLSKDADLTIAVENLTNRLYRVKDSRIDASGTNVVAALEVRF